MHEQALQALATQWVDMAQRQSDLANEYKSARADGVAEALRLCALMLRELLANAEGRTSQ